MKRRRWGRWLGWGLLGAAVLGVGVFLTLPTIVDRRMNTVEQTPPYVASERARALHDATGKPIAISRRDFKAGLSPEA